MLHEKRRHLENGPPRIPRGSLCVLHVHHPLSPDIVTFPDTTFTSEAGASTNRSSMRKIKAASASQQTRSIPESLEARQTSPIRQAPPIEIYTAYAESERSFFERRIATFYGILKKQRYPVSCHADEVAENSTWQQHTHLETAKLIILLVSPDFLNTVFCYHEQVKTAVKRHRPGHCYVIPLLVRPTPLEFLQGTPFGDLEFLPRKDRPIPYEEGPQTQVFHEISNDILEKLRKLGYYS